MLNIINRTINNIILMEIFTNNLFLMEFAYFILKMD